MDGRPPEDDSSRPNLAGRNFPCAQCGAALAYDPAQDALSCAHCGHVQPRPEIDPFSRAAALEELDYATALAQAIDEAEVETSRTLRCGTCGAETAFGPAVTASACPFCASPFVAGPAAHRHFKPKGIAPFLISEREARAALRRWLGSRWFAPGDLKDAARAGRSLSGVYLPYWTFDAATASTYEGERGDVHHVERWVTVVKNGARRRVRRRVPEVRWRRRAGQVSRQFDDVLVLASESLPPSLSEKLSRAGAFDLDGLAPYAPSYLAGFGAETYGVDLQQGFAASKAVMAHTIRRDVRLDIGGDRQRIRRIDTRHSDVTFKHVLLPVWIAVYRYRGRPYRYLVNGRTGVVMGERPWSAWRIGLSAMGAVLLIGALLWMLAESGAL